MPQATSRPRIEVLGLYSPRLSAVDYEEFIARHLASLDPADLSAEFKEWMTSRGRNMDPPTAEELEEEERRIRQAMDGAAFVEALVSHPDSMFDIADFRQADPDLPEGDHQAAWNEKYLSEDGTQALSEQPRFGVPTTAVFRVVFVIHFWKPALPLATSYGSIECPPIQPLPERLWRLAPYELVD